MKLLKRSVLVYTGLFLFIIFALIHVNNVNAYSVTGHEDFKKITFVNSNCRLLNEYSTTEINKTFQSMGRNAFGWNTVYYNLNEKAFYEGVTIFSRSNKSNSVIKFDYVLNETEVTETSVKIKGSVSTKITGSIKKVDMTFNGAGEYDKETGNSFTSQSKTTLTFNINPNTKLSLIIRGECYVTTGVSRYRFFGITFKKGSWENIDVETIIYELREEQI